MKLSENYTNILREFDGESPAVLSPFDFGYEVPGGFPDCVVLCFTKSIIEKFASLDGARHIADLGSANGVNPIYAIDYNGTPIAFCLAYIGAPAAAGQLDELIAMGAKKIVVFGSCGALDASLVDGHIVIPAEAMRDEGTSYHYAPASDSIFMDEHSVEVLKDVMDDFGYPYIVGKTWTTDGIYRETRAKVEARKAAGCITVDMECSALMAVTAFRGVKFAQFIYAADNLDAEKWERRGLTMDQGLSRSDIYMQAAFECAVRL